MNRRFIIHDKASLEISDTENIQEESAAKLICVYVKTIESLPNLMNNENEMDCLSNFGILSNFQTSETSSISQYGNNISNHKID